MKAPHKFALFASAFAACLCYAGVKVTVNYPSSCQNGPVTQTLSGKLSEVQLSDPVGQYFPHDRSYSLTIGYSVKDCCTAEKRTGKTATFKVEKRTVTWNMAPEVRLPAWQDRATHVSNCPAGFTNNCPSVVEWDRFTGAIRDHEMLHHSFTRGFYLGDLSGYFSQQQDESIPCKENIGTSEIQAMARTIRTALDQCCDAVIAAAKELDRTDMENPPGVDPRVLHGHRGCQ
jgi:hypothetical protein